VDKGTTLLLNGKIGPAIAAFRAAAAADPLAPEPYRGLVFAYVARRDRPSADAAFASYLRLRPAASDAAELRRRIADLK
jgi:Flp pilus assembly protein TadD